MDGAGAVLKVLSGDKSLRRVCLLVDLFLELLVALEELKLTLALNLLMPRIMLPLLSAPGSVSDDEGSDWLLFFRSSWACRDRFIALSLFARRYSCMIIEATATTYHE